MPSKKQIDTLARIANASYQDPKKRALYSKTYGLQDRGLVYDADTSDKYHAVYLEPNKKKVYMSIRGTSLDKGYKTAFEDLLDDAAVATNNISITRRYKDSDSKLKALKEKYPDYDFVLASHSLGGSVGYELGKKYDIETHNFSTGSGYKGLKDFKKVLDPNAYKKHNFYHTKEFDLLSETSKTLGGKHRFFDKKDGTSSSHSLTNFLLEAEVM
jgi:hypothetical protein